jgi:hypothetical protein
MATRKSSKISFQLINIMDKSAFYPKTGTTEMTLKKRKTENQKPDPSFYRGMSQ